MPLERFIPFRKHDVSRLCENVIVQERTLFRTFSTLLVNRIHYQYHEQLEGLKDSYNDFDPNKDTRDLTPSSEATRKQSQKAFSSAFANLLNAANFEKVTNEDLEAALNEESLFKVRLAVSFEDFEDVVFYRRGESVKTETLRTFSGCEKSRCHLPTTTKWLFISLLKMKPTSKRKGKRQLPLNLVPP